jgi:carboxypeptidase T
MKKSFMLFVGVLALALLSPISPGSQATAAKQKSVTAYVYAVTAKNVNKAADRLVKSGFDVSEAVAPGRKLLVYGNAQTGEKLRAAGFRATRFTSYTVPHNTGTSFFFGGYPDPADQNAHLTTVSTNYPNLTRVYDVGDSWRKARNRGGHDIRVICISNIASGDCQLSQTSNKPRFFMIAQLHARELVTGEVAYRMIDHLTQNYGSDPEVTSILNNTEVWIIPVLNPDGVDIVKQGASPYLQRKNANDTRRTGCANPPTASSHFGVDLNRNSSFGYGGVGSTTSYCAQTYRGTGAASENETQALQGLANTLFPDQRGPARTDPAPLGTKGLFVTIHAYGNLMLFPYGDTITPSPNDAGMRSTGFRMSYHNGYNTGLGSEILYSVSGSSDDYVYGTLGIASFTYEIGPSSGACSGFAPAYSCVSSTFWTPNRNALLQGMKLAQAPYQLSLGPSALSASASPTTVSAGTSVTVTATVNDNALGATGISRPAAQSIAGAQYCVDALPGNGCTATAMSASDGTFNATSESVTATIDTTGWSVGQHLVTVRGQDSAGNWGAAVSVFVTIT